MKDFKSEVLTQICEKYSSRVCIILVLEKTKCLVRLVLGASGMLHVAFKKVMLKLKEQLQIVSQLHLQ